MIRLLTAAGRPPLHSPLLIANIVAPNPRPDRMALRQLFIQNRKAALNDISGFWPTISSLFRHQTQMPDLLLCNCSSYSSPSAERINKKWVIKKWGMDLRARLLSPANHLKFLWRVEITDPRGEKVGSAKSIKTRICVRPKCTETSWGKQDFVNLFASNSKYFASKRTLSLWSI